MQELLISCRLCKGTRLIDVINLGEQVITSRFPVLGDTTTPKTTIILVLCEDCGLVQLKHTVKNTELYEYEYGYRSGISNTMKAHLENYNKELQIISGVKEGDFVLDIGSNDSTFLRFYNSNINRIGIDPTGKQFVKYYSNNIQLIPTYFTKHAVVSHLGEKVRFKCVSSISMFYDLPDPVEFAKDIHSVLEDEGIWTLEQSYILTMLERNSIDTICHEHLEYYAIRQIYDILTRADFKIIKIELNDCNGGSMRVFAAKSNSSYKEDKECVNAFILKEESYGINTVKCYTDFQDRCKAEANKLVKFIDTVNNSGKEVWIYGASTKGNCLLQYANINSSKIRYAVERNLDKVGKMTSTGIEIISEDTMRAKPPAYLLVLPWHFRDEIIKREDALLSTGVQLIFPFPNFEIVSKKKKALITGWSGQIANYVRKHFEQEYSLYGIGTQGKDGIVFSRDSLEHAMDCITPDCIIHLSSISNSEEAKNNVLKTLEANGITCAKICEHIFKRGWKTKLINASSSEIYKGHIEKDIKEDDTYYNHLHPYSIGKILSHTIIQYYRKEYSLPFSNTIIFMTESPLRNEEFLLTKIKNHASSWSPSNDTILELGSLESYRNVNHADDIASAIYIISKQDKGDDYITCSNEYHKVIDIVKKCYALYNIVLKGRDHTLYDILSNKPVIKIFEGFRTNITKINGECLKLKELGWIPKYTLQDILVDILNNKSIRRSFIKISGFSFISSEARQTNALLTL